MAKVVTDVPEEPSSKSKPVLVTDADLEPDPPSHRGREKERELQRENLQKLLNVVSNKDFWVLVRGWTDPKKRVARVTSEQLRDVFQTRLNPPEMLPPEFNRDERERHKHLADLLPARTVDTTPNQTFSRPFTIEDIEEVKCHIRKHNIKSAPGMDRVSYRKILEIPNDILVQLFQASCCLLKVLTLLIDKRLQEWAEFKHLVPNSQNGFRKYFRTNNNPFILRCAIEKAWSQGKPLYVAFVDLKNAFPSTDLPTLWAKLFRAGVCGPLFD
ncbi:hypothetical protein C8R43DRAFT_877688, partial [Mycena crocata]